MVTAESAAGIHAGGVHAITTSGEFAERIARTDHPVVVDFWAAWCAPCRRLYPEFERLAGEYASRLDFVKVDIEALPEVYAQLGVQGVPTVLVFRGGHEIGRIAGPSPVRLRDWIERTVAG